MRGRKPAGRVACLLLLLYAAHATATDLANRDSREVCQSMDIRNNPDALQKLKGCRIIEGQLSIVLMEHISSKGYNFSFPDLYEVTDYLLIYRMQHISNLGDLFPNLSVVRGLHLFKDYSVVIFDNENLVSLGLRSLTHIERGAVRIQHNDRLCYVNTIDWTKIMGNRADNNVIKGNYDTRLCGLCPNAQGRESDRDSRNSGSCPADVNGRLLCWNDKHCQKVCPPSCGNNSCTTDGKTCCDSHCLGGCDGPGPDQCHVCKDFSLGYGKSRKCVQHCPSNMYKLYRRCVSEVECRAMPPLKDSSNRQEINIQAYKTLNDSKEGAQCLYSCPSGFEETGDRYRAECEPCPASGCSRQCSGGTIDSAAAADRFSGCTIINGNLTISPPATGNIVATLEKALKDVREIRGTLKIHQSLPLVSLTFFKNLERIIGDHKTGEALNIYNNRNLELLWDWEKRKTENKTLEIRGKYVIQFNPKLCEKKIDELEPMTFPYDHQPNVKNENGADAFCNKQVLKLTPQRFERDRVVLSWNPYCVEDARRLLGYSLYYIMTNTNITLYEQRDACSDTWNVIDFVLDDNRNTSVTDCTHQPLFKVVANLIPDTRYAAYVKTFTTRQDKNGGAQSPIIYFKTLPGRPSPPSVSVREDTRAQHNVTVLVSPPVRPNGTVTEYVVHVQANSYNLPRIMASSSDYCSNPSLLANIIVAKSEAPQKDETAVTGDVKNGTCQCREDAKPSAKFDSRAEQERTDTIAFENELQNWVYVKQTKAGKSKRETRIRRSIDNMINNGTPLVIVAPPAGGPDDISFKNTTDANGFLSSQHYTLPGDARELTIGNLRHFTWYTVSLWACRGQHPNETTEEYKKMRCSDRAFYTFRTMELTTVDTVGKVQASEVPSNMSLPDVSAMWEPPVNPNGFVVAYSVHLMRVEDNTPPYPVNHRCVSQTEFKSSGRGVVFRNVSPGNYSVRVTLITVSGAGNASMSPYVFIAERTAESGYEWIWGVVGGILIVILVLAGGAWYARRNLLLPTEGNKLFASVNPEYVSTVYVPDEWEVPRANVELVRELGQGSFGMVYEGIGKGITKGKPETRCAVKTVNEHATDRERIEFLNEASVMKAFDTFHVVRLLGVVSRGQPTLVVMELMEHGDLKTYLRSHRPESDNSLPKKDSNGPPPTLQNILQMAIEIADGMAYLSAKKFVHRDLAARNCMVAGDLTVKVGDFGMTRDIYETDYYRKGSKGLLPVRWMSPESLKDGVFSSSSDIWSFGVVLWEMATLAMQPYQGLSNEQVLRYVVEGGVMERPEHCPDRLYELMRACWAHRPAQRPAFLQLVNDLSSTAAPYFRQRSFFHTPQGQELFALQRSAQDEEQELPGVNVGAVATGSGSNLFGVSGRLASWVRELSSLRSHASDDAAAEPLQPQPPLKLQGPNGVLRDERYTRDPAASGC